MCRSRKSGLRRWRSLVGPHDPSQHVILAFFAPLEVQDVATSLWALAKINWRPEDSLLDALQSNMLSIGGSAKPQELSMMLWACATLARAQFA